MPDLVTQSTANERAGAVKHVFTNLRRRYEGMGSAATIIFFALLFVGMFFIWRFASICVICIAFGSDAYFHGNVRFVRHRSFLLNNGREIVWWFVLLHFAIWGIATG